MNTTQDAWAARAWADLPAALSGSPAEPSGDTLAGLAARAFAEHRHGDLSTWLAALARLPEGGGRFEPHQPTPVLGDRVGDREALARELMALHPWRKGPLALGGVTIDTEWRSDWKWDRLAPHVDLDGATVLDVGCGNGYFGWRMLGAGARAVVGVDPTLVFVMQWLAQRQFAPGQPNFVLPLRDTDLPATVTGFDCVFTMGVLYHRRDPGDHLARMACCLRPGGQLVLETLVLDRPGDQMLVPEGRYARMRNVWYIPTPHRLLADLSSAGFQSARVVSQVPTTAEEQRSTAWMRFESLDRCLDPEDPGRTIEGHPGPVRAVVVARLPGD